MSRHVWADGDLSLREAHDLVETVEARLRPLVRGPVVVHLDPWPGE